MDYLTLFKEKNIEDCKIGNVIIGLALSRGVNPYADDTGEKLPWD